MKSIYLYLVLISLISVFFSSCGINTALITNHNQNATEVHLSENNFKVMGQVSGSSEACFILAIGGLNKKQLYENAYSDMLKKANLLGSSKTVINVFTEEHVSGFFPFFVKRTLTVSAHVVEFTR